MVTKVNFGIQELQKYFIDLQNESLTKFKEISDFSMFNHFDINDAEKFHFDQYPIKWIGERKCESIQKCMLSGKDKTRGLNTIINKSLLKMMPTEFGEILCAFVRHNLYKGVYNDRFLVNKLVPIPKKGDASLIKNNRFLSVPNSFASIQGKFVAACLSDYLEKHKLLFKNQFGFRAKRSCAQAIATLKLSTIVNFHGKFVIMICIDLKNAFGMICYALILYMLGQIVHSDCMAYFRSAFRQRSAVIVNNGQKSDIFKLPKVGVPQGEPTSPVFFSLIIDRLRYLLEKPQYKNKTDLVCFADDTTALVCGETMEDAVELAERFIDDVVENLSECGLEISAMKSAGMIVGMKNRIKNFTYPTEINTKSGNIKITSTVDLLGYKMADNFKPHKHIESLKIRLITQQNYIRNLLNYDTKSNLLLIAHSLHFGLSNYLLDILPLFTKSEYQSLQKIINNTVRMILGLKISDKIAQSIMLSEIGWKTFSNFHKKALLCHINRIIMNGCPEVLYETIIKSIRYSDNSKFQARNDWSLGTKNKNKLYDVEALKGLRIPTFIIAEEFDKLSDAQIKNTFPFSAYKLFNELPPNIRETLGVEDFDLLVDQHFTIRCQHAENLTAQTCSSCKMGPENSENLQKINEFVDKITDRSKDHDLINQIRNIDYRELGPIRETIFNIKSELAKTYLIQSSEGYLVEDDFAERYENVLSKLDRVDKFEDMDDYVLAKHLSFGLYKWSCE